MVFNDAGTNNDDSTRDSTDDAKVAAAHQAFLDDPLRAEIAATIKTDRPVWLEYNRTKWIKLHKERNMISHLKKQTRGGGSQKLWSEEDIALAKKMREDGKNDAEVGKALSHERTAFSVDKKLRISKNNGKATVSE